MFKTFFTLLIIFTSAGTVLAHSGRTDFYGGHTDEKTGDYHYHGETSVAIRKDLARVYKTDETEEFYVGSKNSNLYHRPRCRNVRGINEENFVFIDNKSDTKKDHLMPCKICAP